MRIHALLSWFDESPTWLSTCVAGLGRFCDTLIAVDGAYSLYPGGRPRSHPQQAEAILHSAEAMGLGCLLYQPQTVWYGNEVEKRNKCLDLAGTVAEEDDWLAVIDADYHVLWCQSEQIRAELAETEHDVATYLLLDGKDFQSSPELERFASANLIDSEWTVATRDLYRWNPCLRVGPTHASYSLDGRWLRGPYDDLTDCHDLRSQLIFYHRTQDRSEMRRRMADSYYKAREKHAIEVI